MSNRATRRSLEDVQAVCQSCGWNSRARNALAGGARHHDHTAHVVDVEEVHRTTYGDGTRTLEDAGQTTLEDTIATGGKA